MMKSLLILLIVLIAADVQAQIEPAPVDSVVMSDTLKMQADTIEMEIFTIVERMPEFPGGKVQMYQFIGKNLVYSQQAKENDISGRVIVQFIVFEDGSLHDIKIVKGLGYGCDEEVIRVIKLMPNWNPGRQRGKPVKVYYSLPVKFQLN